MKTFFLFLIVFGVSNIALSQTISSGHVFQSWNEVDLIVPLVQVKDDKNKKIDKITATFSGILRVGRKDWDFLDDRAGMTLDFRVNKYLSLFAGALYRRDEVTEKATRYETRLITGTIISKIWNSFSFRDRNMLEHRFRNGRNNINVYRQRIQISHPLKYNDKEFFSAFISEEGYYDIGQRAWFQNEFLAGITRRINPHISLDIAYLRADSKPVNVNGMALNLRIKLR